MSIPTIKWDKLETWRLFSKYPGLDKVLDVNREGVNIQIPRTGTYQFRTTPPIWMPYYMRYREWYVTLEAPKTTRAALLSKEVTPDK